MMAISLQEFFLWQKVYAAGPFENTDCSVGDNCEEQSLTTTSTQNSTTTSSTVWNKQSVIDEYGVFFSDKFDNNTPLCWKDHVKRDEWWTISCSSLNRSLLDNQFCSNYNNLVWTKKWSLDVNLQNYVQWGNNVWWCACPNGYAVWADGKPTSECLVNTAGNLWINCGPQQLKNGTCTWNINKTLWIRSSETTPNPTLLLQDVVLAATSFIGTLIMIALVVMGVKYVQWWFDESATGDLKGNIKKLLIWLFLVIGSYTIIRLVQYVARGY